MIFRNSYSSWKYTPNEQAKQRLAIFRGFTLNHHQAEQLKVNRNIAKRCLPFHWGYTSMMNTIFGLSFILFYLKLSAGLGYWIYSLAYFHNLRVLWVTKCKWNLCGIKGTLSYHCKRDLCCILVLCERPSSMRYIS